MATNRDWSQCPGVESIPGKVSGAWTFRNSRTPVKLVSENLEEGMTLDEITEQYAVSREEIKAVPTSRRAVLIRPVRKRLAEIAAAVDAAAAQPGSDIEVELSYE